MNQTLLDPVPGAFLITGIPGAGKTTTARHLAKRFGRSAHVEGDVLSFDFIASGLADPSGDAEAKLDWDAQMALRRRNIALLADSYTAAGFMPVIDDVVTNPGPLGVIMDHLLARPVRLVVLAPPLDSVRRRDEGRQKHVFELWQHLDAELRSTLSGTGLWIEDPELTVDQVVDLVLAGADSAVVASLAR